MPSPSPRCRAAPPLPSALRADGRGAWKWKGEERRRAAEPAPPPAARQRGWGRWRAPKARDGGGMCLLLGERSVRDAIGIPPPEPSRRSRPPAHMPSPSPRCRAAPPLPSARGADGRGAWSSRPCCAWTGGERGRPVRAARGREGSLEVDGRGAAKSGGTRSSPGRAAARMGEVARAARRATEGACVFCSASGRCGMRSGFHRQSPRSAPGLQHSCPPRRRAAARRHPSHPRRARTGGEPACLLPRPRAARMGEAARAARRATEGACTPCFLERAHLP